MNNKLLKISLDSLYMNNLVLFWNQRKRFISEHMLEELKGVFIRRHLDLLKQILKACLIIPELVILRLIAHNLLPSFFFPRAIFIIYKYCHSIFTEIIIWTLLNFLRLKKKWIIKRPAEKLMLNSFLKQYYGHTKLVLEF